MDARTLLKRYGQVLQETQFLRGQVQHLNLELNALRPQAYKADQKIDRLEQANQKLLIENRHLKQKLKDLTSKLAPAKAVRVLPAFVKANVPLKKKQAPGRKQGHAASHRPVPTRIDQHRTVDLGIDS